MSVWGPILMQRCKTCKWWGVDWSGPEGDHRICDKIVHSDMMIGIDRNALAYTCDAEMYASNLFTQSDFGCVLHEPKEG